MGHSYNNFTIITSGGCNSKCDFCTDPMNYKASNDYIPNLFNLLMKKGLPHGFNECSISGGEPTISPDLKIILQAVKLADHFNKVVLTTNGTKLLDFVDEISDVCNHVNVSRHAIGYEDNVKVFKNKQIISDEDLTKACEEFSKKGIDINLNHVYDDKDKLTKQYVHDYITYAKSVNATKVTFRYDQNNNSLEETYLEKYFSDWKKVDEGGCPVCKSSTILLDGTYVTFKSSFQEPSRGVDSLYELIYHPSGKLTTDWEGKEEYKRKPKGNLVGEMVLPHHNIFRQTSTGGCGSGGCGRVSTGGCGSGGC